MERLAAPLFLLLLLIGCDNGARQNRLERQNADLKAELERDRAARDFDLRAKCAKDARMWFNENWRREKNTILLEYVNHYNKNSNSCVIEVELHFSTDAKTSDWTNDITIWNVYENTKLGDFTQNHAFVLNQSGDDSVFQCDVEGNKCMTLDQFRALANPLLTN